jgi:hypothetical protein
MAFKQKLSCQSIVSIVTFYFSVRDLLQIYPLIYLQIYPLVCVTYTQQETIHHLFGQCRYTTSVINMMAQDLPADIRIQQNFLDGEFYDVMT